MGFLVGIGGGTAATLSQRDCSMRRSARRRASWSMSEKGEGGTGFFFIVLGEDTAVVVTVVTSLGGTVERGRREGLVAGTGGGATGFGGSCTDTGRLMMGLGGGGEGRTATATATDVDAGEDGTVN